MKNILENMSNRGGVYIIVNVLDCKAYIGQAKKFNDRSHLEELEKGTDNDKLQKAYNNPKWEFVYFVACYTEDNPTKEFLNKYEKLYMSLIEDLGFHLYNLNIRREDREPINLNISKEEYDEAIIELKKDFKKRFDKEPEELVIADMEIRRAALEYYVNQRLDKNNNSQNLFSSDRFLFNRARIAQIFQTEEISLASLDLSELFISKAGNYIGEGIDQIINYEVQTIKNTGYCLWTLANNAVSVKDIRESCRKREAQGKEIYVLFSYTPSSAYASKSATRHSYLKKSEIALLHSNEMEFLKFEQQNGRYFVPKEIDCTAANSVSASALVIQDIFLLKENVLEDEFKKLYYAVRKGHNLTEAANGFKQRSTSYLLRKENQEQVDILSVCTEGKQRSMCFLAKLAAPYIIELVPE